MIDNDTRLFKGSNGEMMSLNNLFTDIYSNSKSKSKDLKDAIKTAMDKIQDSGDVVMLMPMIRDLYEVGVRNDDQLVRLAAIIQKYISSKEKLDGQSKVNDDSYGLTEEEKRQLTEEIDSLPETNYKLIEEKVSSASVDIDKEVNDASE